MYTFDFSYRYDLIGLTLSHPCASPERLSFLFICNGRCSSNIEENYFGQLSKIFGKWTPTYRLIDSKLAAAVRCLRFPRPPRTVLRRTSRTRRAHSRRTGCRPEISFVPRSFIRREDQSGNYSEARTNK